MSSSLLFIVLLKFFNLFSGRFAKVPSYSGYHGRFRGWHMIETGPADEKTQFSRLAYQ